MNPTTRARNPAMDVIRCTALCCVASVHFFMHTGFYYQNVSGPRMYVMTLMRCAFMSCVPLFLMLSGYLMRRKRPCAAYYRKLLYTLGIYVLAALTGLACKHIHKGENFDLQQVLTTLLSYKGSNYGWYIEMYIGLFLLAPYVNILCDGLQGRKQRLGLVFTLLLCTSFHSVLNIHDPFTPGWWHNPSSSTAYFQILPDWWKGIYPLTYYVLGGYLRDYPLKLSRRWQLALLPAAFFATGTFAYYRSAGGTFLWGEWQQSWSLFVTIQSVLLFSLLARGEYRWMGPRVRRLLEKVSELCLGAYLVSWIVEGDVYPLLTARVADVQLRLNWFPVMVPAVLLGSLALSAVLNWIWKLLDRGARALCAAIDNHR